jgi:hypothetical protein
MHSDLQTLTLQFPVNVAEGTYCVTVQATSGSFQHSAGVSLEIEDPAGFSVVQNNSELSFAQGQWLQHRGVQELRLEIRPMMCSFQ